jgi:hypothetical protein
MCFPAMMMMMFDFGSARNLLERFTHWVPVSSGEDDKSWVLVPGALRDTPSKKFVSEKDNVHTYTKWQSEFFLKFEKIL